MEGLGRVYVMCYKFVEANVECRDHPRVKFFAWRACLKALPTRAGLGRRVLGFDSRCMLCGEEEESGLHALACLCGA